MNLRNRAVTAATTFAAATATTLALVATSVGTAAASPEADAPGCSTGRLPNVVMGSPDLKPGQALGLYLWHGSNGYSLRATHPGTKKVIFSGVLTASNGFSHLTKVALEGSDNVSLSTDHKTLRFRFANYGRIDGLNFAANCSRTMRVRIGVNGSLATPRQIKLGKHRSNPTSNPFTIQRSQPAPSPSPSSSDTATATIR